MLIDDKELNQIESKITKLKQTKSSEVAGTNKQENFDDLIREAEYYYWQLSQSRKCGALLDDYYDYRDKVKKATTRRLWLCYLGFFFAYAVSIFCVAKFAFIKNSDIIESLKILGASAIVAIVIAGIHLVVNCYIFHHIDTSGIKDIAFVFLGTMLYYLILFLVIAIYTGNNNDNLESIIENLVFIIKFSGVAAGLHVWINSSIFLSIKQKDENAYREIKKLEDEIRRVSSTVDTHRPLKESIPIWKTRVYCCIDELSNL